MAYSEKEVKAFAEKDLRISKLAIVKSLIEKLPLGDVCEVEKITELAENYVEYVYKERNNTSKRGDTKMVVDWVRLTEGLNLAKPNTENIKIFNLLLDEYKQVNKASVNPSDILTHIIDTYGKYPAKTESVKKVVQSLVENL